MARPESITHTFPWRIGLPQCPSLLPWLICLSFGPKEQSKWSLVNLFDFFFCSTLVTPPHIPSMQTLVLPFKQVYGCLYINIFGYGFSLCSLHSLSGAGARPHKKPSHWAVDKRNPPEILAQLTLGSSHRLPPSPAWFGSVERQISWQLQEPSSGT